MASAISIMNGTGSLRSVRRGLCLCRSKPVRGRRQVQVTRAVVDPSVAHVAHGLTSHPAGLEDVAALLSSKLLVLGDVDATAAAAGAVDAAADAAAESGNGPIQLLASGFESFLTMLDSGLEAVGVPYSYGFAIILLTILVKLAAFPLTKKQMESTLAMQALQPQVKEIQARYGDDTERVQMATAELYREANVNPLSGCLPVLIQLPVFIGLYRSLTQAANDGLLTEGFFWVPSLGGPTSVNGQGIGWLVPFVDGQPPLGWSQTAAYLSLPVLLVVSQYLSQKIISPPSDDPAQKQTQAIMKFLPFMIGYFSLNVPSGLSLYWLTNNFVTTAQQILLKSTTKVEAPELRSAAAKPKPVVKSKEEDDAGQREAELLSRRKASSEKLRALKARQAIAKAASSASAPASASMAGAPPVASSAPAAAAAVATVAPTVASADSNGDRAAAVPPPPPPPPAVAAVAAAPVAVAESTNGEMVKTPRGPKKARGKKAKKAGRRKGKKGSKARVA